MVFLPFSDDQGVIFFKPRWLETLVVIFKYDIRDVIGVF